MHEKERALYRQWRALALLWGGEGRYLCPLDSGFLVESSSGLLCIKWYMGSCTHMGVDREVSQRARHTHTTHDTSGYRTTHSTRTIRACRSASLLGLPDRGSGHKVSIYRPQHTQHIMVVMMGHLHLEVGTHGRQYGARIAAVEEVIGSALSQHMCHCHGGPPADIPCIASTACT